jgi:hypothetical protein
MKKPARTPQSPAASATAQLEQFIDKFDAPHQRLIRAVRAGMRRRLPTAHELVYDNYNFFVIGYGATERPSDAVLSIAAGSNGVSLCFLQGAALSDPHRVLSGAGSRNRFVRLESAAMLDQPAIAALIDAAVARSRVPMPGEGKGQLIIRSVSAKQRPRRKAR